MAIRRSPRRRHAGAAIPSPTRALLADPALQAQLDDHGWVVVPLLDEASIARLIESYAELPHVITTNRSFAAGFHATIIDERPDYRRAAHEAIAEVIAGPMGRVLCDMTLAMTNWVHKEPGSAAVPLHADWTFVDEAVHRSVSMWAPLVDTGETSGCIGVVDRSHRDVSFVRASTQPGYVDTDRFAQSMPGRLTLPLRAGHGVLFDHRLIHFSEPHHGPLARVAITAEYVPAEAELYHYEQISSGRFRRHLVHPDFFVEYSAGQDPPSVRGHVRVDEVNACSFDQVVHADLDDGARRTDRRRGWLRGRGAFRDTRT